MTDYFAAQKGEQLLGELNSRIEGYYNWILMTQRLARWRQAYNTYYGQKGTHNSSYVTTQGDKGELSFLMSNEYRNLVQHLLVLGFQSRVALEMVTTNTDSKSKSQSYLAKGIVEYYRRDGTIDMNCQNAAEMALLMDTAWVFNEWDTFGGDVGDGVPDLDRGVPVPKGDIKSRARSALDVIIDFTKLDPVKHDWRIVRDPINKYDLAAQYPEKADALVAMQRDLTKDALFRFGDIINYQTNINSADVDVWTFFHRRSPALPQGRMVQFVDKFLLFDGPIPYRKLPGNRICPSEQILSPLGYSNANDVLGLQDVLDALVSSGVTNMTTCGVNNLWTKPNPGFNFEQLAQGMKLIESDDKPEVLIMNKLPPEWFNLSNFIIQRMETYLGMNQVARGNVEAKEFSGAAMALLQSMSVQFNSGFTRAVNRLIEDCGNDIIQLTQDFAHEPKLGIIIGEANKYMMKNYSSSDISDIQRVYCRQSNPMKDTTAGRLTIVEQATKNKGGLSQSQFAEIIDTGNTDCLLEQDRNAKLAIDQENEALMKGEEPPVVFIENHPLHIQGHSKVISAPEDKGDVGLVERVRRHIDQHLFVWGTTDPNILQALGIPPLIQPMPMMPPGSPPGGSPPKNEEEHSSAPGPNAQAMQLPPNAPPGIAPAKMPINPLTGKRVNPEAPEAPPNIGPQ